MGYQYIQVGNGYSIFIPTFKDISGNKIDLASIVPCQQDGSAFETTGREKVCTGTIKIQKLKEGGAYDDTYWYYSTKKVNNVVTPGWYKKGSEYTPAGKVFLNDGEGFAVNNTYAPASGADKEPVTFKVSGEVDLVCKNLIPTGYSINGNSTPVKIDLASIVPCQQDGSAFETTGREKVCTGTIKIQKLKEGGAYDDTYWYYSTKKVNNVVTPGWYKKGSEYTPAGKIFFEAGEGFAVNNTYAPASGADKEPVLIQLPLPIGE